MQIQHIRIGNIFWLVKNERYGYINYKQTFYL